MNVTPLGGDHDLAIISNMKMILKPVIAQYHITVMLLNGHTEVPKITWINSKFIIHNKLVKE